MSDPWFHDGLKFTCTGCGDCCTGEPGYVWVNKAEIAALAGALGVDVAEFERRYVRKVGIRKSLIEWGNGDCIFFHRRKPHLPGVRRTAPSVPHMALLALQPRLAGNLGRYGRALPGLQPRSASVAGGDSGPELEIVRV